jgi:hypothetical protein
MNNKKNANFQTISEEDLASVGGGILGIHIHSPISIDTPHIHIPNPLKVAGWAVGKVEHAAVGLYKSTRGVRHSVGGWTGFRAFAKGFKLGKR